MKIKNRGYVLPVAIGVLVVASLGILMFSWLGGSQKQVNSDKNITQNASSTVDNTALKNSTATDDQTLENDSTNIDAQIKALDSNNVDVDSSLNDSSSI